jgi:hypothetical protein
MLSWSLWIADVLSHCTHIYSPLSDECSVFISSWTVMSKLTLIWFNYLWFIWTNNNIDGFQRLICIVGGVKLYAIQNILTDLPGLLSLNDPYTSRQLPNTKYLYSHSVFLNLNKTASQENNSLYHHCCKTLHVFTDSPRPEINAYLVHHVLSCLLLFSYHAVWCSKLIFNSACIPHIWRHCQNFDLFIISNL